MTTTIVNILNNNINPRYKEIIKTNKELDTETLIRIIENMNPLKIRLVYDYHLMVETETGQWAEKHGSAGDSILWPEGMTPDTIPWTIDGTPYYDSKIIYLAVGE